MELPFAFAAGGIGRRHPTAPALWIVLLTEAGRRAAPGLAQRRAHERSGGHPSHPRAPIPFAGEKEIIPGVERRATSLPSPPPAPAKTRSPRRHWRLAI